MRYFKSIYIVVLIVFALSFVFLSTLNGQSNRKIEELNQLIYSSEVDSLLTLMSREEQIAQLFWIPVFAPGSKVDRSAISKLVEQYQPGGLLYFRTDPELLIEFTNQLQQKSKIPLIVSLDGEWGLGMRLNNTISFPYQMALGAIQNDTLIYKMGLEVARQFKRMGMHVNFAPVVDVNVNPANPVINYRSFGENSYLVAQKSIAYMNGMQDGGVMAVAKHFPGHGDTNQDSHKTLPLIPHNRGRLDSIELYPFKQMVDGGVLGVMSGHLEVPALEAIKGCPASLSKSILTDLLRNEMHFRGLVISDAMNMNGVKRVGEPGKVDALALIAGNDIIEFTESLPDAIKEVKLAVDSGLITWDAVELKVRRALALKLMLGVDGKEISTANLSADISTSAADALNRQLYRGSITVVTDTMDNRLPLKVVNGKRVFVLAVGEDDGFLDIIKRDSLIACASLNYMATSKEISLITRKLKGVDQLVVVVTDVKKISNAKKARKSQKTIHLIDELCSKHDPILVFFGNPYAVDALKSYAKLKTIVVAYQDNRTVQEECAKVLLGEYGFSGKLPVSIDNRRRAGCGIVSSYPTFNTKKCFKPISKVVLKDNQSVIDLHRIKGSSLLKENYITSGQYSNVEVIESTSKIADENSSNFFRRILKRVHDGKGDSIPEMKNHQKDTVNETQVPVGKSVEW